MASLQMAEQEAENGVSNWASLGIYILLAGWNKTNGWYAGLICPVELIAYIVY